MRDVLRRVVKPVAAVARDYFAARLEPALAELREQASATQRQIAELSGQLANKGVIDGSALPGAAEPIDVNMLLHRSRAAMLRQMPPGARTLLSAGCSGTWYFEWVEQCYGPIPEHIGIEFYSPRPTDLPANVTWIANTVSDMSGVASASCDLVFSGQNVEHLWPEEVSGFMVEAARVTRPGGCLVVDSPNRALTPALNWSHPEHTVELTAPEMVGLFELAGFDVTKTVGLWLCRDPRTGRMLPFDPNIADADWSVTERLVAAPGLPEHAFLWWVEGTRTDRAPDVAGLQASMARIFAAAWPERVQRLLFDKSLPQTRRDGADWLEAPAGWTGAALFGPYMPLRAGHHSVTFDIEPAENAADGFAVCDAVWGDACVELARVEVPAGARQVRLDFTLPELRFGVQFRCMAKGGAGFRIRRGVTLA